VPLAVNAGPAGTDSVDVPFIDVTLCIPGTTTCQTIQYVSVDTGSSGMRVLASALTVSLPQQNATTGAPLTECFTFEDGYVWGSVRTADLRIGGELAAKIPIEVIGDPAYTTVPSDCASTGSAEDTLDAFGSNGIIGINQIVADCGSDCTTATAAGYYSCASASTCTSVGVALAAQISNPIPSFATDNNGAILQLPSVAAAGDATTTGSLIFGIGTQANNGLGSAAVLTTDDEGNISTIFNGATLSESYIDSGTNYLAFDDTSITQCPSSGDESGFFCPTATVSLSAQNKGLNGTTSTVDFSIANATTLFGTNDTAFSDLGGTGDANSFAWGLPFFLGRSVYVAVAGASTPGGAGPYFAY
jgi:hypothetical protein